ncbi:hypothetical protein [Candidatus Protochlamydia amoebophila]|uniref:Uncharacterized protein n=1 Tax=Protochlamydia amoebophila (strain UWE25) TaxID=264201 RepID=Q6MAD4_PARUW|nr:hypothetical protein [Candidatus Protochlamydia amoebophila]CAF24465.1 unnamed protein product [Candidatus Protochlamydia amoebophila UWE25]
MINSMLIYDVQDFNLPNVGQNMNILTNDGDIESLIEAVNADQQLPMTDKIRCYMNYLSQTLSSRGRLQGKCESLLKTRLYDIAKLDRLNMQLVIKEENYKNNSKLKGTIEKLDYLASRYLIRAGHQLKNSYVNNKSYGVSYFGSGLGLFLTGLMASYTDNPSNPENDKKDIIAWTGMSTGVILLAYPFFNSFYLAYENEP